MIICILPQSFVMLPVLNVSELDVSLGPGQRVQLLEPNMHLCKWGPLKPYLCALWGPPLLRSTFWKNNRYLRYNDNPKLHAFVHIPLFFMQALWQNNLLLLFLYANDMRWAPDDAYKLKKW